MEKPDTDAFTGVPISPAMHLISVIDSFEANCLISKSSSFYNSSQLSFIY